MLEHFYKLNKIYRSRMCLTYTGFIVTLKSGLYEELISPKGLKYLYYKVP